MAERRERRPSTPDAGPSGFSWSDAWVLLAIDLAAGAESAALTDVIGAADGIQHAIVTRAELDGAVGRLGRAGLVERVGRDLHVTPIGRQLLARAAREAGRAMLAQQDAVGRLLGAPDWSPGDAPDEAGRGEREHVSAAEYDAALEAYYARARTRR